MVIDVSVAREGHGAHWNVPFHLQSSDWQLRQDRQQGPFPPGVEAVVEVGEVGMAAAR